MGQARQMRNSPFSQEQNINMNKMLVKEQSPLVQSNSLHIQEDRNSNVTTAQRLQENLSEQNFGQQHALSKTKSGSINKETLIVPLSPPDSEDQTTPQAPRKLYGVKQTSVDSTNSFSENDDILDQHSNTLKRAKEDPETTKKKEIHKNLMSEAIQKVELKNSQKK